MSRELKISLTAYPIYFLGVLIMGTIVLSVDPHPNIFVSTIPVALVSLLVIVGFLRKYYNDVNEFLDLLRLRDFNVKKVIISALLGVVFFVTISVLLSIIGSSIFNTKPTVSDTSANAASLKNPIAIIFSILVVGLLIPIVEELFYRGLLLGAFERTKLGSICFGVIPVILNSLLFALMHFQGLSNFNDVCVLLITFLMGVFNGIVAIRSKSLYNSMAVHSAVNTLQLCIMYF